MRSLIACAVLILFGCAAPQIREAVQVTQAVCSIKDRLPVSGRVAEAADLVCRVAEGLPISVNAPGSGVSLSDACRIAENEDLGPEFADRYRKACPGSDLEDFVARSFTAFLDEAKADFPHLDFSRVKLVYFDGENTDARLCGPHSVTAISACGTEVFVRFDQLATYRDEWAAAVFVAGHEVGHVTQYLLGDTRAGGPKKEQQATCFAGAWFSRMNPTEAEKSSGLDFLRSIGDLPTHGTARERVDAALVGARGGTKACLRETTY